MTPTPPAQTLPHTRNKVYRVFDKELKMYLTGDELNYWFEHPDSGESYDIGQFMRQPQRFWVQEKTEFVATRPDGSLQALYEGDLIWVNSSTDSPSVRMVTVSPYARLLGEFNATNLPVDQDNHIGWSNFVQTIPRHRDQTFRLDYE